MKTNIISQAFKPKALALAVATLCLPCTGYAQTTTGGASAQHFAALDTNGDASLDESELMVFANNYTLSTDEIMEQFDTSDSGELEFGEFTAVMNALSAPGGVAGYQPVYVPVITEQGADEQRSARSETPESQPEERQIQNPDRGQSQNTTAGVNAETAETAAESEAQSNAQSSQNSAQNNAQAETMAENSEALASDAQSEAMIALADGDEEIQQSPESAADTLREDTTTASGQSGTPTSDQQTRDMQVTDIDVPQEAERVVADGKSVEQSILNTPMTELSEASVVNATGVTIGEVADIVVDIDGQQAGIIFTDEQGEPAFALTDEVSYTGNKLIIDSDGVVPTLYDSTTYDATRFTSVPVDERTLSQVLSQQSVSYSQ